MVRRQGMISDLERRGKNRRREAVVVLNEHANLVVNMDHVLCLHIYLSCGQAVER